MPYNRNPRVEILEETEDSIRFELSNTDTSMANALRRIMIAEVKHCAYLHWDCIGIALGLTYVVVGVQSMIRCRRCASTW